MAQVEYSVQPDGASPSHWLPKPVARLLLDLKPRGGCGRAFHLLASSMCQCHFGGRLALHRLLQVLQWGQALGQYRHSLPQG